MLKEFLIRCRLFNFMIFFFKVKKDIFGLIRGSENRNIVFFDKVKCIDSEKKIQFLNSISLVFRT